MLIKNNALVLYKSKGAIVTEISADKYQIRTASGDRKSVRAKDIELLHPGPCQVLPAAAAMPDNTSLAETAELMGEDTFEFADFTELVFGSFTPSAALTAVEIISSDIYFSGTVSGGIRANSAEHIARLEARELQKKSQQAARAALLERIKSGSVIEEDRTFLREIEFVACGESSSSKLLHDLDMQPLPEKAQNLLLKLGVWNEFDNNPWPRRFEIDITASHPDLPAEIPQEERLDLTALAAYAIDDADSNDPDDAISYDPDRQMLWVHVADPGAAVKWESELEKDACARGCTLYMPEKITTMLPENSVSMFGLGLSEKSPALSFGVQISADGHAELKQITRSIVAVQRMNYDQAEELINNGTFKNIEEDLQRFRDRRAAENAVMIRLPEVKVKVDIASKNISIKPLDQSPVRELVANAMLSAGSAVAAFAVKNDIPLAFSVQEAPEMTERPESISGMYELRKSCRQSHLSTLPGKHAGLGLEPYVRVTSPLRRYEDLLNHIQLRRYLTGESLLSISDLDDRLAEAESAAVLRAKLERQCREYWTLVYLKNQPSNWQGEAIFVAKPDDRSVWLLPALAYEFKNRYNARLPLGESVKVECIAADPAMLTSQFKIVKNAADDPAEDATI